jgi:hypothetical protein
MPPSAGITNYDTVSEARERGKSSLSFVQREKERAERNGP